MKPTHFTKLNGQIITGTYNSLAEMIRKSGLIGDRIYKLEYQKQMGQPTWKTLIKQLETIVKQEKLMPVLIEKTGMDEANVYRFFRAKTIPKLDTFLKISDAITPLFSEEIKKMYQDAIESRDQNNMLNH